MKKYSPVYGFSILFFVFSILQAVNAQDKTKPINDTTKNKIAALADSAFQKKKREIIKPVIFPRLLDLPLENNNFTKESIDFTDYRNGADFITNLSFGLLKDLGSVGQPSEALIYGNGFGRVSFMRDGIPLNTRLTNSFDLNLFQSENTGLVETLPLPMGFLFGTLNNPSAVNIVSAQPDIHKPFSRIKFYQAPNSEGLVDGTFSVTPFSKLNGYFELTNQSVNPIYTDFNTGTSIGTDHSNWMGLARLSYFLSNKLNLIASFQTTSTNTELFGGVDPAQVSNLYPTTQFTSILYNNLDAPATFTNRYQKVTHNDFSLRLLCELIEGLPTDLSVYYQRQLTEFRQNEYADPTSNDAVIMDDNKSKTYGLNFRQEFEKDIFKISAIMNIEGSSYSSPLLPDDITRKSFSTAGIGSVNLFDNKFTPSVFAKYLNYSGSSYFGTGAYGSLTLDFPVKLYGGFSSFEKPRSIFEEESGVTNDKEKINTLELSGRFKNRHLSGSIGYFMQSTSNALISASVLEDTVKTGRAVFFNEKNIALQGLNLNLDIKIWKIQLSTNTSYYFNAASRRDSHIPDFTACGGAYYIDTLFNRNLKLKTGFTYYSVGEQDYTSIDFEKNITSNYIMNPSTGTLALLSNSLLTPSLQIDFFLAGRIHNTATIYFVFQNLTNAQYMIVPYYPKQERGLRFGVAWEFLD